MKRFLLLAFSLIAVHAAAQNAYSDALAEHRAHYKAHFLTESRSPLTARDTAALDFFSPDSTWRLTARFQRTPNAPAFQLATYSGQTRPYQMYGIFFFERGGRKFTLPVYRNLQLAAQEKYRDHLFLPFKDLTNGETTYGGGRYLDLRTGDIAEDGSAVVDFNKAYNPWCAYSDGFSCPIPPAENELDLAVEAGERQFKGEKKH